MNARVDALNDYEKNRYHRQMLINGWGQAGQLKLRGSRVFIAGAGGLGSPVAIYLTIAGVGEIHICDADKVELSNLNRQILHTDDRIGQLKTASAEKTLRALNPYVRVVTYADYLDDDSVARIVGRPDVVVDCLDNFETRYLLNAYCVQHRIPLVHGAIWGLIGQLTFLAPPDTPCFRCIFAEPPPRETFPVLGATPGVVGTLQAMETLKYLTGVGMTLQGTLLFFNGEDMTFDKIAVTRNPDCPVCRNQQ